jgi:hypothetical protein
MIRPAFGVGAVVLGLCVAVAPLGAGAGQMGKTEALAQELTSLLQSQKRDAVAARLANDEFVAALYLPDTELLVVSGKYAAPALLFEKIISKNYKDAYLDLSTASMPDSKILIEDLKSDGIRATSGSNQPFDMVTKGNGEPIRFDGQWKKRKMSEADYLKAFSEAEEVYQRMLTALVAELKK